MNINSTLFFQGIVFLLLVWFTMKFVWPPIMKALDERANKIAEGLSAADKAKSELVSANQRVEQQLSVARDEMSALLADAERRAQVIIAEAKERASTEAENIISSAQSEAEQQLHKAREELRDQVAVLAVKGAEQILRKEVNAKAHQDMLNRLSAEL